MELVFRSPPYLGAQLGLAEGVSAGVFLEMLPDKIMSKHQKGGCCIETTDLLETQRAWLMVCFCYAITKSELKDENGIPALPLEKRGENKVFSVAKREKAKPAMCLEQEEE